jgi:hypothetical protein
MCTFSVQSTISGCRRLVTVMLFGINCYSRKITNGANDCKLDRKKGNYVDARRSV